MQQPYPALGKSYLVPLATAIGLCLAAPAYAQSSEPIKIGVIAEVQSIAGAATPGGAQIAADEINAKGGVLGRKIEIVTYDNKSSSADSVRAFQRAVSEDKVSAVIASYISEVVLALEPWAARLKMPLITPGAASNEITKAIHNDYEKNKYTFHGYLTSAAPLVSFQKVGLSACALMPNIGIGTCWFFHCTVGCTPTWEMPVTITSGFLLSMLLKIGVKSVVSGEKRMCSTTFNPAFGRQAS